MDITTVRRDPKVVEEGQWIKKIPQMGDMKLKVRGLNAPSVVAYRAALERNVPRSEKTEDGTLTPDAAERVFSQVMHEKILLDWDNVTENKKAIPYSPELAEKWCTDPWYRGFADAVVWAANAVDNGFQSGAEELAKNSKRPSSGDSGGGPNPNS